MIHFFGPISGEESIPEHNKNASLAALSLLKVGLHSKKVGS